MAKRQHNGAAGWIKSSYSGGNGGDCVEIAPGFPTHVPVRDSKNPTGPTLHIPTPAWATFTTALADGDLAS
ncbi:DUF397 domain-containing protein [Streptomyces sp. NPDC021093]|uniref:DUF397 domain-containing protein n=1 Tax=Streptomyces sp. NPDC021093 TaxID=3365112 RepID=UPI00379250B9